MTDVPAQPSTYGGTPPRSETDSDNDEEEDQEDFHTPPNSGDESNDRSRGGYNMRRKSRVDYVERVSTSIHAFRGRKN